MVMKTNIQVYISQNIFAGVDTTGCIRHGPHDNSPKMKLKHLWQLDAVQVIDPDNNNNNNNNNNNSKILQTRALQNSFIHIDPEVL